MHITRALYQSSNIPATQYYNSSVTLVTLHIFFFTFHKTFAILMQNKMELLLGCKHQEKSTTLSIWTPHDKQKWLSTFSCLLLDVARPQPHGGTTQLGVRVHTHKISSRILVSQYFLKHDVVLSSYVKFGSEVGDHSAVFSDSFL